MAYRQRQSISNYEENACQNDHKVLSHTGKKQPKNISEASSAIKGVEKMVH